MLGKVKSLAATHVACHVVCHTYRLVTLLALALAPAFALDPLLVIPSIQSLQRPKGLRHPKS